MIRPLKLLGGYVDSGGIHRYRFISFLYVSVCILLFMILILSPGIQHKLVLLYSIVGGQTY